MPVTSYRKAAAWGGLGSLLLLLAMGTCRTMRLKSPANPGGAAQLATLDTTAAAERLAGALRIPTVVQDDRATIDWAQWPRMHDYLRQRFPRVHSSLTREVVADYSLLYTWRGSDPGLKAVLLLAHMDVVPIPPGSEGRWTHPPFAGVIADGYVWGRGAIDDKGSLLALLEATEHLLERGFAPRRPLILAFGHDEEIAGPAGAASMSALLAQRGIRAWFSLDEGGAITSGLVPGAQRPIAFLDVGEKGTVTLRLSATDLGGHASFPRAQTAVSRVARAVALVQDRPLPQRLLPPVMEGLRRASSEMPWPRRFGLANEWLLAPVLKRTLAARPETNALTRTTTAATLISGGDKVNVLPAEASAVIKFFILPGESMEDVEAHVRDVIDDPEVRIERIPFSAQPPPMGKVDSDAFTMIERSINAVFPEAVVAPGLALVVTDNRQYAAVRDDGYYFVPARLAQNDVERIHGVDERVSIRNYHEMVSFYVQLMRNALGE